MKKTCLSITAALLSLLSGWSGLARAQAVKDVNVANTPNVNVTNTPSVNVSNTPTVNVGNTATVTVSNTPTVNVANTPSVNIKNDNTQPAIISNMDDPGRIPYQSHVSKSGGSCTGTFSCTFEFGSVPPGHRVVIQHISGLVSFTGTPNSVAILLNNGSGFPVSSFFAPLALPTSFTAFDQTVQAYLDPAVFGGLIEVVVNLNGTTFPISGFAEDITLSGYELDCSAAPCSPIAH